MAPEFRSSFIPKDSVTTEQVFKKKKAGFVGILVASLFVCSLITYGSFWFYKGILKDEIAALQSELANAEKNTDKDTIEKMDAFSKKLEMVESIVFKHQVVSGFLDSLASSTVSLVYFNEFNYGALKEDSLSVTMKGRAASYAAIALQEQKFSENPYFKSVSFSNLSLADKGAVSFDVSISIDPKVVAYNPPVPPASVASSTSSSTSANDDLTESLSSELEELEQIENLSLDGL